jgi:peptide/nickel transport system ATP-binding protein/oligopeptide transport system ATP-binding protein
MNSIPKLDKDVERLEAIPGSVPSPLNFPEGCKFNTRCPLAEGKCFTDEPELIDAEAGHKVRCWRYKDLEDIKARGERIYADQGVKE